jgi:hypothetical protein
VQSFLLFALQAEFDQLSDAGIHEMRRGATGGAGAALNAGQYLLPGLMQNLLLELFIPGHS